MSLYTDLKAAGVPLDSHESDLYAKATPEAKNIIEGWHDYAHSAKMFKSQIDGEWWFDIPFAFEPFWEAKQRGIQPIAQAIRQTPTAGELHQLVSEALALLDEHHPDHDLMDLKSWIRSAQDALRRNP